MPKEQPKNRQSLPAAPAGTVHFFQIVAPVQVGIACEACHVPMEPLPTGGLLMANQKQPLHSFRCPKCAQTVQTPQAFPGMMHVQASPAVTDLNMLFQQVQGEGPSPEEVQAMVEQAKKARGGGDDA